MIRILGVLFGAFCLMGVIGCSQYVDGYEYTPRPALAQIPATQPNQGPPVTANVYVAGVRYEDQDNQIPPSIEIRMSVDNTGSDPVWLNPQDLNLTNAQMLQFMPAIVRPPTTINIGPMQSAYITAYFPFPPGDIMGQHRPKHAKASLEDADWLPAGRANRLFQSGSDSILRSILVCARPALGVLRRGCNRTPLVNPDC